MKTFITTVLTCNQSKVNINSTYKYIIILKYYNKHINIILNRNHINFINLVIGVGEIKLKTIIAVIIDDSVII